MFDYIKYILLLILKPEAPNTLEWKMLYSLNSDRKKHGLTKLFMQGDLREVARIHSKDMADKQYFDHVNKEGKSPSDRLERARISDTVSGENLAMIGGHKNKVTLAQDSLMKSPGHRKNILNPDYNCVGIGLYISSKGVNYFTQNFAKRYISLRRNIPHIIRWRKRIKLKGRLLEGRKDVFFVFEKDGEELSKAKIKVKKSKFNFTLELSGKGKYTISLLIK